MSGDVLVPTSAQPIRGVGPHELDIARNQFTYDEDPAGLHCPFGAHVRARIRAPATCRADAGVCWRG